YLQAGDFIADRAVVVTKEEEYQLIDAEGENYLLEGYDQVWPTADNLWLVEKENKYGAINAEGAVQIPLLFDELQTPSEGFAVYRIENAWGYLRIADNTQLVPPAYPLVWPFHNGLARVATRRGITMVDTTGKEIFIPRYTDMRDLENGLIPVQVYR
ncbi:MAG: WG repeat-containing protein, partial [Bacteroidota bacterium]